MTFVGAAFNGVDTRLTRGGPLTGAADSPTATVSYWIRKNNADYGVIYSNPDSSVSADGQNNPSVFLLDTANANGVEWNSVVTINDNAWHHIIASVNFSAGQWACYIDGAPEPAPLIVGTPGVVHLSSAEWAIGDQLSSHAWWHGDIAEVFISTGYLDLSVPANLRKFWNAGAIDLGADGSLPFGSPPLVYLSARSGDAASVFATNRGTGGGFTSAGTFALSDSGPNAGIVTRGGAGRRYIVKKDGTRIFPRTDVEFRRAIAEIVSEVQAEFVKEKAPIKRKPGRKPKAPKPAEPSIERWNTLFAAVSELRSITEAQVIRAAQLALDDEEDVILLM